MANTPSDRTAQPGGAGFLAVDGLVKHFPVHGGLLNRQVASVQAVDGVSFSVQRGETLGIVGESGCGKSTTARLLMRLLEPDAGSIVFDGQRIGVPDGMPVREMRRRMQMVFQDSYSSLNPRLPIEDTIAFGPTVHGLPRSEARARARDILGKVGLDPNQFIRRYAHELSGGQRQRVNIARALALEPRLLILDEAVSALDKSVEAQVLNLLGDLKRDLELTYIFISHDLNVVQYISDRVLVMYLGKVVELGRVEEIYANPRHPYTRALLSAMPSMDPQRRIEQAPLSGDPPNPINPPSGCRFHTRCEFAEPICADGEPVLEAEADGSARLVACKMFRPGSGHSARPAGERPVAPPARRSPGAAPAAHAR
jgi:peptide/nickel transport system ATP-binding protein